MRNWNFGDFKMNGKGTSLGKMRNTRFCQPRRMLRCHAGLALGIRFSRSQHKCQRNVGNVAKVLESLPSVIRDCRVDVQVDNQAVIHTWMGRGGRSRELTKVAQHIFQLVTQRNILLQLSNVPSKSSSLSKSDSMLSKPC